MNVKKWKRQLYLLMLGAALSHFSIAQFMNTYQTPVSFGNFGVAASQVPFPTTSVGISNLIGQDLSRFQNGFYFGPQMAGAPQPTQGGAIYAGAINDLFGVRRFESSTSLIERAQKATVDAVSTSTDLLGQLFKQVPQADSAR